MAASCICCKHCRNDGAFCFSRKNRMLILIPIIETVIGKWYSIKDLKEVDGRLQLLSSQKMSSILKPMVDEKMAQNKGSKYIF